MSLQARFKSFLPVFQGLTNSPFSHGSPGQRVANIDKNARARPCPLGRGRSNGMALGRLSVFRWCFSVRNLCHELVSVTHMSPFGPVRANVGFARVNEEASTPSEGSRMRFRCRSIPRAVRSERRQKNWWSSIRPSAGTSESTSGHRRGDPRKKEKRPKYSGRSNEKKESLGPPFLSFFAPCAEPTLPILGMIAIPNSSETPHLPQLFFALSHLCGGPSRRNNSGKAPVTVQKTGDFRQC